MNSNRQSTIFPNNKPCEGQEDLGRGFRMGSRCYTVPDLFNPEKQLDIMLIHYKAVYSEDDIAGSYVKYAGTIAKDNPIIQARVKDYEKCLESAKAKE